MASVPYTFKEVYNSTTKSYEWLYSYKKEFTNVTKKDVWQALKNVDNWPKWQKDIKYVEKPIKGFVTRGSFMVTPNIGSEYTITLSNVDTLNEFTGCIDLVGAQLFDQYFLEETYKKLIITETIKLTGSYVGKMFWLKFSVQNMIDDMAEKNIALVEYARKNENSGDFINYAKGIINRMGEKTSALVNYAKNVKIKGDIN